MFLVDAWKSLRRRFARQTTEPKVAPRSAEQGPAPHQAVSATGYLEPPAFRSCLLSLTAKGEILYVLSLADIAAAGGEKWGQIKELVTVAVRRIVDDHIDPEHHHFTFLDANTLCLVMPGTPSAAGWSQAEAIADAITGQLVGKQGIGGQYPVVRVSHSPLPASVGAPVSPQEDPGLAPAWLEDQLAGQRHSKSAMQVMHLGSRAGQVAAPGPAWLDDQKPRRRFSGLLQAMHLGRRTAQQVGGERPDWLKEQTAGRGGFKGLMQVLHLGARDRRDAGAQQPDWLKEQTAGRGGFRGLMRVLHLGSRAEPIRQSGWEHDQKSRQRFRRLLHVLTLGQAFGITEDKSVPAATPVRRPPKPDTAGIGAEPQGHPDEQPVDQRQDYSIADLIGDNGMGLLWTPSLVTNRNVIGVFNARVVRAVDGGKAFVEGAHAYAGVAPADALELDRFAAEQTAHELRALYLGRQRTTLTVPVHWMSLAPRWQNAIPGLLEQCPAKAREGFLKIEVFGLQAGMPTNMVKKLFEPLEHLGSDIIVRLPLAAIDLIPSLRHVQAVGVDLEELDDDHRAADQQLFAQLRKFSQTARKSKIACYVWGVAEPSWVEPLQTVGYSLINGPAVSGQMRRPEISPPG